MHVAHQNSCSFYRRAAGSFVLLRMQNEANAEPACLCRLNWWKRCRYMVWIAVYVIWYLTKVWKCAYALGLAACAHFQLKHVSILSIAKEGNNIKSSVIYRQLSTEFIRLLWSRCLFFALLLPAPSLASFRQNIRAVAPKCAFLTHQKSMLSFAA